MSRGERAPTSGNLSHAMRHNYAAHGVDEYYRKVGSSYRNPHFPGVRHCLFLWLNRWWEMEYQNTQFEKLLVFDMACGSGEVTVSVIEWWALAQRRSTTSSKKPTKHQTSRAQAPLPPPLSQDLRTPRILAADPFTSAAYRDRTSLACASLSFRDISNGALSEPIPGHDPLDFTVQTDSMVICSFALHLVESASDLFSLLWELSTKFRWMIVLAPHKKPEIKDGWGWSKWNVETWQSCLMHNYSDGEFLQDRVHCRIYRSVNF